MCIWLYVLGISGYLGASPMCLYVCVYLHWVCLWPLCPGVLLCLGVCFLHIGGMYLCIGSLCPFVLGFSLSSRGVFVSLGAKWVPVSLPHHSVGLATLVTTVSTTWMSVPLRPARMEASVWT